jgi:hypothetical protein
VSTLVTSSTHSGSAPGAQATQVSLSTGVHMSQVAPTDSCADTLTVTTTVIISNRI